MELAVRAAAACCSSSPSLHPPRVPCRLGRSPGLPLPARRVAVAAAAIALDPFQEIKAEQNDASKTEVFACPVCYEPLIRKGPPGQRFIGLDSSVQNATSHSPAKMSSWISLSPNQERKNTVDSSLLEPNCSAARSSPFFMRGGGVRTSIGVASLAAMKRKFASSGAYSSVIALDFSENILHQCL